MAEFIQGNWDDLVGRQDLRGRKVRVIVLEDDGDDPWIKSLRAWANSHEPLSRPIDDSRDAIYSGTVDDPR